MPSPSPTPPPDVWVDLEYVCHLYNVGPTAVRNAIKAGDLPAHRVGAKHLRFRLSDVEAWARPVTGGESA